MNRWRSGLLVAACSMLPVAVFADAAPVAGKPIQLMSGTKVVAATISSVVCQSWNLTGAAVDPCTVNLSSAAPSTGLTITLATSNKAVAVPATISVPANASSMWFNASVSSVAATQSAIVTASANSTSSTAYLQLNANASTLSLGATSLAFGSVQVNTPLSKTITLTSSGTAALTISGATVTGTGFSLGAATLPATLSPGQSLTLSVQFDPTTAAASTGTLAIASNSTTGATTNVSLTGTGTAVPVSVSITPGTASVAAGATQQFTASVANSTNSSVIWTVAGSGCSGAGCGAVSANGVYTAPTTLPSPATVTVKATSSADTTKSASGVVTITSVSATGTTYYLAPSSLGGSDSNNGLSASTPWLTPHHSVKCGDVILATPSSAYNSANFGDGDWGTVSCTAGNNVAWLACASFDGCKMSGGSGILIDQSYWGVRGWEVSTSATYAGCFAAAPNYSKPTEIHHIIFANNVANGCQSGGFITYNDGTASVDYISIVGNVAYNAAEGSAQCYSGISIYEPIQSDSQPGTHIYVAGNISYGNIQPNPCAGTVPPGADGIIFDTFDGVQAGFSTPYSAQAVADNNILIGNDGNGFAVQNNSAGSQHAPIYVRHNTSWGNNVGTWTSTALCSEILINVGAAVQETGNLAATNRATGCGGYTVTAYNVFDGASTDSVQSNVAYSASGANTTTWGSGSFTFGSNMTGQNPNFPSAAVPGAPSCSGAANAPACMASVIANFTPANSSVAAYGYQKPSTTPVTDSLFPQWLCNANLPAGLVTSGCQN